MRDLFAILLRDQQHPSLAAATTGLPIGVTYVGVSDVHEIFNNKNERDITIEIEVIGATSQAGTQRTVNELVAVCRRSEPNQWRILFYSVEDPRTPFSEPNGFLSTMPIGRLVGGSNTTYDATDLVDVIRVFHGAK
jgi:hypothetical protein